LLAKSSRVMPFIRSLNTSWTSVSFSLSWYTPQYIYIHTHIYIYTYICMCVLTWWCNTVTNGLNATTTWIKKKRYVGVSGQEKTLDEQKVHLHQGYLTTSTSTTHTSLSCLLSLVLTIWITKGVILFVYTNTYASVA
jgi:hypothetical protein